MTEVRKTEQFFPSGALMGERYRLDGDLHRTDGPAVIEYTETGSVQFASWFRYGERHREGGPAAMWSSGNEEWWCNGRRHREGGPAEVCYDRDGNCNLRKWMVDGELSRIDGPAWIEAHWLGAIERWFFRGVPSIDGPAAIGRKLLALPATELEVEMWRSAYEPLLLEEVDPRRIASILAEGLYRIEHVREVLAGAPAEWVRSFVSGESTEFLTAVGTPAP